MACDQGSMHPCVHASDTVLPTLHTERKSDWYCIPSLSYDQAAVGPAQPTKREWVRCAAQIFKQRHVQAVQFRLRGCLSSYPECLRVMLQLADYEEGQRILGKPGSD